MSVISILTVMLFEKTHLSLPSGHGVICWPKPLSVWVIPDLLQPVSWPWNLSPADGCWGIPRGTSCKSVLCICHWEGCSIILAWNALEMCSLFLLYEKLRPLFFLAARENIDSTSLFEDIMTCSFTSHSLAMRCSLRRQDGCEESSLGRRCELGCTDLMFWM